jgi:UDP:flavonoid glycosyltransferase YjiC (YdhE family)
MRVLFASTEGSGHFNPLVPFIEAFAGRGDEVLVVVPPKRAESAAVLGHPYRIGDQPPADEVAAIFKRFPNAPRSEAAVLMNREVFGRLCTAAMLPAVEAACREWQPDLVLREPCEYSSAVAAGRLGIPHAQIAISLAEIESGAIDLVAPALEPYGEHIAGELHASPYLTRFPASLDPSPFAATHRFREAAEPRATALPDWWEGSDAPLVYVTFGSVTGGLRVGTAAFRTALAAVDGLPARVLLTVGRATNVSALGPIPPNVHVEAWVPQADVLDSAALVVCHGGSGTTFGALAAGVPLVVVPLFADQPANARLVSAAGAGLVVTPTAGEAGAMGVPGPEDVTLVRAAIESVLADSSYRAAAERLSAEMRAMPTVDELINTLVGDLVPTARSGNR